MKSITILNIILVLFSCNAQDKNKQTIQNHTEMTTEKFDIKTFNENQVNDTYSFERDDVKVEQIQTGEGQDLLYTEYEIPNAPELFFIYKEFYSNGVLKEKGKRFKQGKFQKGVWQEYDEKGKLIKETNYDTPYDFNFEQLVKLLDDGEFNIDLLDKNTAVGRGVGGSDWKGKIDKNPTWYISWEKEPMRRETLKVDGINGAVLEQSHYQHEDN